MGKKSKGKLPRVDRSRALPVRSGWGLWKTLAVAGAVAMAAWFFNGPDTPTPSVPAPAPATIVEQR
jgi:hypothetical protein